MIGSPGLSIVLSTFNRCQWLPRALSCLLHQQLPSHLSYEVIVVDNNSTDATRSVVERYKREFSDRLRYVFEPRQGLSFGRNTGITSSRSELVAFTDDDVVVANDWVAAIHQAFDAHPEVECLGGRTLPVWPSQPPAWLTRLHWVGPLALQDYGEDPFVIDRQRPICIAGANLAFRRSVFDRVGPFSTAMTFAEDTELLLRLWRAGGRALYVPNMIVHAIVQPERLTKAYHRKWHVNIGRCNARMGFEELADPVVGLRQSRPELMALFGLPGFAVRQLVIEVFRWLRHSVAGHTPEAFLHEMRARALIGYIRENREIQRGNGSIASVQGSTSTSSLLVGDGGAVTSRRLQS
jgi:glycosyltransferase involved in cell wall biosynthesis